MHGATYRSLVSGIKPSINSTNFEVSPDVTECVDKFSNWLQTLDGEMKSKKTADMYRLCITKILVHACDGKLHNFQHFEKWIEEGNFLDQLMRQLTASSVQTYIQAMRSVFLFLESTAGQYYRISSGLSSKFLPGALSTLNRWYKSLSKGKQKQDVARVGECQTSIPALSTRMQTYIEGDAYM